MQLLRSYLEKVIPFWETIENTILILGELLCFTSSVQKIDTATSYTQLPLHVQKL